MNAILAIAAGGAVGAVARYFVMVRVSHWLGADFPYGTLTVNIVGSFIFGAMAEAMALAWTVNGELRAFLVVGLLGSFTTFSTFSLDVVTLIQRGQLGQAGIYALVSVVVALVGFILGMALLRLILA